MLQREGGREAGPEAAKSLGSLHPRAGAYIRANLGFKERSTELYTLPVFNAAPPSTHIIRE